MSGTLIETKGYDGKTLFIAKDKILAMRETIAAGWSIDGNRGPVTLIWLAGSEEEWFVREAASTLRIKYDNS